MTKKLLLADDSVTVQRVIELTFADEGMQVVAVGDGRQAVERIGTDAPDIVLADVSMPELDGYAVAAHVKGTPALAHIPVVLMTGAFEQIDEARAAAVGCDGVLAKPFEPHMVIALVRQLLGESRRSEAETAFAAPDTADGYPFEPGLGSEVAPSLDEYFDRLDEALAEAPVPVARPEEDGAGAPDSELVPGLAVDVADDGVLADAFAALLADELGERPLPRMVGPAGATADRAPVLSDEQLDDLARRVAERLAPAAVAQAVNRQVLDVAERIVREEIARIRAQA